MAQGAGLFSRLGGYVKGAAGASGKAFNALSPTGKGAVSGAALGGLYGAMDRDTSVLGGAAMGAGLGAGAMRYGGAGARGITRAMGSASAVGAPRPPLASLARRGAGAALGQMRGDFRRGSRGTTMFANSAANRIKGLGRIWT